MLSLNGQVLGVSEQVAARLGPLAFGAPQVAGQAIAALGGRLRIGVPFPFSMQAELLHYWLERAAPGFLSRSAPCRPRMAAALLADEIDGFCVGEPWGSHAVEMAGARLLFAGSAIWSQAPEKVLACRSGWMAEHPDAAGGFCVRSGGRRAGRPRRKT